MTYFTDREIEAVRTYAEVGDIDMAAARMGIAYSTMRNTLQSARWRAEVRSSAQLVYLFSREGLLHNGRRHEDDLEYMQVVEQLTNAVRERDEARDTACRLEEELARRPPL